MSFIILPGRRLNILENAKSITSSDPEAGYDPENVANGVPSHPFKFDDPDTDDYLLADLDQAVNGDMEDWVVTTEPVGWEATGTVARESVIVNGGTYSCELADSAYIDQIVWVQSGWSMTITAAMYGGAVVNTSAYLQNLYTGKWLKSDGDWQAAEIQYANRGNAAWVPYTIQFDVESYVECGYQHLVPLRMRFKRQTGGGVGYVDDVALWPNWDFVSIHGHNIPPSVSLIVQSDDNSGMTSPTNVSTPTVIHPAFYDDLSSQVTERYARLFFDGTVYQEDSLYIGEWILGQYKTLASDYQPGPIYKRMMPVTIGAAESKLPRSNWSNRGLSLNFFNTDTELITMYEMLDRARGGADPIVIVPTTNEDTVMFGHFPPELFVNKTFLNHDSYDLEFVEMAFPFTF